LTRRRNRRPDWKYARPTDRQPPLPSQEEDDMRDEAGRLSSRDLAALIVDALCDAGIAK
jgi:hypothetical protein